MLKMSLTGKVVMLDSFTLAHLHDRTLSGIDNGNSRSGCRDQCDSVGHIDVVGANHLIAALLPGPVIKP